MKRIALVLAILMAVAPVFAAQDYTITVTFEVPEYVSISVAFGGSCASDDFYFKTDSSGNGVGINVTQSDGSPCQDEDTPALNVTNNGNVAENFTIYFFSALPTEITVKASNGPFSTGYEATCTGSEPPGESACINVDTNVKKIATNVPINGWEEIYLWADASNFNSGEKGIAQRYLIINSTAY